MFFLKNFNFFNKYFFWKIFIFLTNVFCLKARKLLNNLSKKIYVAKNVFFVWKFLKFAQKVLKKNKCAKSFKLLIFQKTKFLIFLKKCFFLMKSAKSFIFVYIFYDFFQILFICVTCQ